MQESGIIHQLLKDVHRTNSKFDVPKKDETVSQKSLTLKDIEMIVFLLLAGYSIAFGVFLVELIYYNLRQPYLVKNTN